MVCDQQSGLSRGGMMTKLEAAKMVTLAGENAIITSGKQKSILSRVFNSEPLGTLFLAQGKSLTPRKRWIGFSAQSKGEASLDSGASDAIVRCGRSLLSIGVRRVKGTIGKGDVITLVDTRQTNFRGFEVFPAEKLLKSLAMCLTKRWFIAIIYWFWNRRETKVLSRRIASIAPRSLLHSFNDY